MESRIKYILVLLFIILIIFCSGIFQTKKVFVIQDRRTESPQVTGSHYSTSVPRMSDNLQASNRIGKIKKKRKFIQVERKMVPVIEFKKEGKYDDAIVYLLDVIKDKNRNDSETIAQAMYELARIFMVKKDFNQAKAMYDKFLKEYPNHPMKNNAKNALIYMQHYNSHVDSFVSFEQEVK